MEVALCAAVFLTLKKRRSSRYDAIERRRRIHAHRRRDFHRRQSRQHMMFVFLLSLPALTVQSPVRSIWMKPRSNSWWEDVVNVTFTSNDWLQNFGMSKATFLCVQWAAVISGKEWHHNEKSYTSRTASYPYTRFLSTSADFHTIGHLFGISKSTVCLVTKEVCNALVAILLPKYIRFPNDDGLKEVVDGFRHKFGWR